MKVLFFVFGLTALAAVVNCQKKPECVDDMVTFTYTECDSNKGRWRVAVPRNDQCKITNPAPPVFGKECGFSCPRGQYLDLSTQECKLCPAGTYSLGSAIRFNTWNSIPDGFTVSSTSFSFNEYGYRSKVANCTHSGWKAEKDYISSNDNDCISSISYAVDVKSTGSVSFTYQCTDEDLIFHFYVQNSDCQTVRSAGRNVFLNTTGASWHTYKVDLEEGTNVLVWKTTGLLLGSKEKLRPALIKDIEIDGVSYTTSCHQCLPGYFSGVKGSDWCKPCTANTYSEVRAAGCKPCNKDSYSLAASSGCSKRPACTKNDYFETHSPCKPDKTTRVTYKWREPKICREDMKESVKLPESGVVKKCPPCNPGFHLKASGGCMPCPELTYSDGAGECQKCNVGTSPNHVFHYKWWDVLPENMRVSCMTVRSEDCVRMEGWIPSSGMIETSRKEFAAAYLLLKLGLDGFRDYKTDVNGAREYGHLTFVFELKCHENCVLYVMKNSDKAGIVVLASWHGATKKTSFTHVFDKNERMNLTWAFQKTNKNDADTGSLVSMDSALIYSIIITNAVGAPADACYSCAAGVTNKGCVQCPAGHFVDSSEKICVKCPLNTYLAEETSHDANCTICLNGTQSNGARTACQNNCKYTSELTGRQYDFSVLSKPQVAITPPSFTDSGRKYAHYYNFSICGNDGAGLAACFDNKSLSRNVVYGAKMVRGMVCRSTKLITAGTNNEEITVFSQPQIISTILETVYHTNASDDIGDNSCGKGEAIFPHTNDQSKQGDIVYVFAWNGRGESECPNGKKSYLHLRCDPAVTEEDAIIETPVKYPDGSCDGCHFHFLWKSHDACPLCTEEDYYSVTGMCEDGFSTTRYLWKSYIKSCKDGVALPDYSKVPCIDSRLYVEIGVLAGVILLAILLVVSCSLWKKSRRLEYKYQKLMMNTGKDGGELPAADSCAISGSESGDSDDEEVMFRKKRKKALRQSNNEKIPLNTMHHSVNM